MPAITRYPSIDGIAYQTFNQHFSSNGDGTGTIEATGDYSVTPLVLKLTPPAGLTLYVYQVRYQIADSAINNLSRFAGLGSALTHGITSRLYRDGAIIAAFALDPIKSTHDLIHLAGTNYARETVGTADVITFEWNMIELFGRPLIIDGAMVEEWRWSFNDNFTGVDINEIQVSGHTSLWR